MDIENAQPNNQDVIVFSDDEAFTELIDKDKTTEICGFIDEVSAPRDVGQGKKFKLFKFVLTNGNKRISICIWGDDMINRYEGDIRVNRILNITGGLTRAVKSSFARENEGFVPFEIVIIESTNVEYKGFHNAVDAVATGPVEVDFDSIANYNNTLVSISGYLKQTLRTVQSRYGNMSYGSTAITNGSIKINIDITNYVPTEIERGTFVTVIGQVAENGQLTTITCKDMGGITPDNNVARMPVAEMCKARKFPKRKMF